MSAGPAEREVVRLQGPRAVLEPLPLATAVALSTSTGRPFSLDLSDTSELSAEAAASLVSLQAILGGRLQGALAGSRHLLFEPAPARPGGRIEAFGDLACGLWLPPVLTALALSGRRTSLELRAPTHAPGLPCFHELAVGWGPLASLMGASLELTLAAAAFSPEENGRMEACVHPAPRLHGVSLCSRGVLGETRAVSLVAGMGPGAAGQMRHLVQERLRALGIAAPAETIPMPSDRGRGYALLLVVQFEHVRLALGSVAERGEAPVDVVARAVDRLEHLLSRRGAVDGRTAAWLLLPAALAASALGAPGTIGGEAEGSRFTTAEVTIDLLRVAELARAFLDVEVQIVGAPGEEGLVEVRARGSR